MSGYSHITTATARATAATTTTMNEYDDITNDEATMIEKTLLQLVNEKTKTRQVKTKTNKTVSNNPLTKHVIKRNEEEKKHKTRARKEPLHLLYHDTNNNSDTGENENTKILVEAGVDEAGRGPLFGRVYAAAVILPSDPSIFDHTKIKDSKKFTSKKKLLEVYDYIKTHAVAYSVWYEDENSIDKINIRQATQKCMNAVVKNLVTRPDFLLIDGCDFLSTQEPYIPFICIEGGDNIYASIAAASILAKVERDAYIEELCVAFPYLDEKYGLATNKGYGTKTHLDGIRKYGITQWHRKTFGICKSYVEN